ncbi:MAG: SDR family oxidoreductase [Anaerolineae bacterium]|jgi:short-subunit dehydrogenase|nr:SDR family oxidoreductase [Anaerolineae bacterium]
MNRFSQPHVVVITGASSGIGRTAALLFAKLGASVVLAARNEIGLKEVHTQIEAAGGTAVIVPTDVADSQQMTQLAATAYERFGRIDTWVNDAAVSIYGEFEQITLAEFERVIQVNVMGVVYGCQAVLPYMRQQGHGTIINIASVLGERSVPLQSAYCASKHAVKGFTESLRMELAAQESGIHVTLILPASINTPFFRHARSKMGVQAKPIPPVYEPEVVAEAILMAAQGHHRRIYAGGASKMFALMEYLNPRLIDWLMVQNRIAFKAQQSDLPPPSRDSLFEPIQEPGSHRGEWAGAKPLSLYTQKISRIPSGVWWAMALFIAGLWRGLRR